MISPTASFQRATISRSAGGTAFRLKDARDSSNNPIPADDPKGRQWIKYVRITNGGDTQHTEIDAVAAVYPDNAWEQWRKENYDWAQLSEPAVSGRNAEAPNGQPNYLNFALGAGKTQNDVCVKISGFELKGGRLEFSFPVWNADWKLGNLVESGMNVAIQAKGSLTLPWPGQPARNPARFEKAVPGEATVSFSDFPGVENIFFRLMVTSGE